MSKFKILFLSATPKGYPHARLTQEEEIIRTEWRKSNDRDNFEYTPFGAVTPNDLRQHLESVMPDLVVQRNELTGIAQHSFSSLGVAETRDAVPPLAPFGEADRLPLTLFGRFGGKDDLEQSPDIRQRHAGLGFFFPDAAVAGPRTKAPT